MRALGKKVQHVYLVTRLGQLLRYLYIALPNPKVSAGIYIIKLTICLDSLCVMTQHTAYSLRD
jgi:hypothetical protein